jgi:uncharacterized membrane protein YidH (DUF202 family)
MRNKYVRRGVLLLLLGIGLNLLGYYLMNEEIFRYGWAMIIGTLLFGTGFLLVIYGLMRRIDRASIMEERQADSEKAAE